MSPVKLDAALTVRLKDSNSASRLSFRINQLLNRQDAAALLVYSQRTVLMYSNKDGKIMLIDNHQHGEKMGPMIVKGLCSHLPQFLNSIQVSNSFLLTYFDIPVDHGSIFRINFSELRSHGQYPENDNLY